MSNAEKKKIIDKDIADNDGWNYTVVFRKCIRMYWKVGSQQLYGHINTLDGLFSAENVYKYK